MTPQPSPAVSIERSVDVAGQPRDFIGRYYESRYVLDWREPGHDYRLLFHSNGVIVVMLAPSHPLVARGAPAVTAIDCQVTAHTNRLDNSVQGKGKRGAQVVTAQAPLFRAARADGTTVVVSACARGKLVQLNEKLLARPGLLQSDPGGEGFVALLLPKKGTSGQQMAATLTEEEYAARRPGHAPA